MGTLLAIVFTLSAVAVFPAFAVSIYNSRALNRYVRENHPDTWAEIAPARFGQPSMSSANARFITHRTYRTLQDPHLNALGDRCFRLLYVAASIFLVLIVSGLAYGALEA
jgi:hypothetical protein